MGACAEIPPDSVGAIHTQTHTHGEVGLRTGLRFPAGNRLLGCSLPAQRHDIPPAKLEHPSIQGLLRKYTTVAGCLPQKSAMYNAARRVGTIHLGAIRKIACGEKVWVGTDEWTSDQGHAIINVLLGVHGKIFVVSTTQVQRQFSLYVQP